MFTEFIKALSLILVAEMGDKTQIIVLTLAAQFTVAQVLIGVLIGVVANHGIAIALGSLLGNMIPMDKIILMSGFLFLFFGYNSLLLQKGEDKDSRKTIYPALAIAMTFFAGEFGDKTQLAALALSAESKYPLGILSGTTTGMILISGFSIYAGSKLGRKIPEVSLKIISSLIFFTFGSFKILSQISEMGIGVRVGYVIILIALLVEIFLLMRFISDVKRRPEELPLKSAAELLYEKTAELKSSVEDICLGENVCGGCIESGCLLGYIRNILDSARENGDYYHFETSDLEKILIRDFDRNKVEASYLLTLKELFELDWPTDNDFVINKVREALEFILFGRTLKLKSSAKKHVEIYKKIDSDFYIRIKEHIFEVDSHEE
ncbi:MAG: TMEM165/GDT1 family protein [Gudongella sp.]|jgi:putative Ca2+/H+ antiporter (TMEM165/GDT1 family)|nr:TMEM165/GDT1 family protein [Gudongella sp.]